MGIKKVRVILRLVGLSLLMFSTLAVALHQGNHVVFYMAFLVIAILAVICFLFRFSIATVINLMFFICAVLFVVLALDAAN